MHVPCCPSDAEIKVGVDPENRVKESDEGNNYLALKEAFEVKRPVIEPLAALKALRWLETAKWSLLGAPVKRVNANKVYLERNQ